jgi:peptidoglycan/xylan/chitin deacetylase (PgdA/CDA1 family)
VTERSRILVHGVTGLAGSELGHVLGDGLRPFAAFRPLVGATDRVVAAITGPGDLIDEAGRGLPEGAARAEAIAVRLRRSGVELEWGEPRRADDVDELQRLCHERGRSSVAVARADPSLLTELQLGSWFDADWRVRLVRRALLRVPAGSSAIRVAADLAFWRGVRSAASAAEWQRLTRSSYVALVYHRLAGERKEGQERVDLAPDRFERQLSTLRRLGFRHLPASELLAFHERPDAILPRRSFVVTVDDGLADSLAPLLRHARMGLQLFVPTQELGGRAHWLDGEPLMTWEDAGSLAAAGVRIGSHVQRHRRLTGLEPHELDSELAGSRSDLREHIDSPLDVIAYPNGAHDSLVRRAASESGFRAAFTTEKGRNGAGTDVYCLRRVSVHAADGPLAVLWKVMVGESLPRAWPRLPGKRA